MTTSLDDAIAQASAAANTAQAEAQTQVPATTQPAGVPAMPPAGGGMMSLDDLMSSGLNVDAWLKIKPYGVVVGGSDKLVDEVKVTIDLSAVQVNKTLRYGPKPDYIKTYDQIQTVTGKPWQQAMQQALTIDPKAEPYDSVDIPMVLREDVNDTSAGTTLGYSTPPTGLKPFKTMLAECQRQGLMGQVVNVTVSAEKHTNGTNEYGKAKWTLEGAAEA